MKVRLKRVLALLLAAAMLASFCSVTVFAGEVAKGTNGKTIYLNWTYYSDKKVTNKVDSLEADTEYYARLGFSGNPIDQGALASICSFSLYGSFDTEKIEAESILSGDVTIQKNIIGNEFNLQWASPDGIINEDEELLAQGCLARICFKTKRAVSSEELHGLFKVNAKLSSGEETNIGDGVIGNPRLFTIVECPAFVARLADNAPDFFPTTTAEKIAENLVGEYIDENGNATAVSGFTVTLPATGLVEGENVVTASYNGYTCDVAITVKPDTMTGISITQEPNMSYNSGDKLNLTGLVVSAQYASGDTVELGSGVYATDPAKNTELTVAEHNGKHITVKVGSFTAETIGTLTVNPADISGASIEDVGPFEYTGEQIKPEPAVSLNGKELVKDTDYTLSYDNNTNVTTEAKVIVTAAGTEYTGSAEKTFEITKATGKLTLKVNNEENAVTITYGDSITFTDGNGIAIGGVNPSDVVIYYKTTDESTGTVYDSTSTQLNVGTYTFWAVRSADANHEAATSNEVVVTIDPRPIANPTATITNFVKGQRIFDLKVETTTPGLNVNYTCYEGTDTSGIPLGSSEKFKADTFYTIVISLEAATNYVIDNTQTLSVTVNDGVAQQAAITPSMFAGAYEASVTVQTAGKDTLAVLLTPGTTPNAHYGMKLSDLSFTGGTVIVAGDASRTPVDGHFEWVNPNEDVGNPTVYDGTSEPYGRAFAAKFVPTDSENYAELSLNVRVHVHKATISIADIKDWDYTEAFQYDGNEHKVELVIPADLQGRIKVEYENNTATDVGTRTATATISALDDAHYAIYESDCTRTLTWQINAATPEGYTADIVKEVLVGDVQTITVTANDFNLPAGGRLGSPTLVSDSTSLVTSWGLTSNDGVAYDLRATTADDADTTEAKYLMVYRNRNYTDVTVTVTIKVIAKTADTETMKFTVADAVYGAGVSPVFTSLPAGVTADMVTVSYTGSEGTYTAATIAAAPVGDYTANAKYETSDTIYTASASFKITPKGLTVSVSHDPITYGDAAPENGYKVTIEGLVNGEEVTYTVGTEYKKGDKVGNYKFTFELNTAVKNYKIDTVTGALVVNPKSIAAPSVTINNPTDKTYTGSPCVQGVSVKDSEAKLTVDDISVTYENNINVGTATIIYTGKNNYTGEIRKNFKITEASITDDMIANIPSVTYNTRAHTPDVTVTFNGSTLEAGKDYGVAYTNNINAGTATVTVTGKGNFTGTASKDFAIVQAYLSVENQTVTHFRTETDAKSYAVPADMFLADEKETGFTITVTDYAGDEIFTTAPAVDGTNVNYQLNGTVGTAFVEVKVKPDSSNYANASFTLTFVVNDKENVSGSISFPDGSAVYTGTGIKYENATISGHSGTLRYGYTPNASTGASLDASGLPLTVGTYTVAVTFNSDASFGYKTATFTITKATPTGTPGYTKLETSGKTLADAKLTVGTIRPAGTIAWDLPLTTVLEDGKAYAWTFTPNDTHNYTILTGTLVPYVDDGMDYIPGVIGGNTGSFNFHDVSRLDYFYDAVKWAAENGIASGTGRYTFSPNAVCTRAQTVTFLWRAAGSPLPRYRVCPFTDVNPRDYYYDAVLWAVEQGITTGLNATTFGPDVTVTRGQVATFLYRAASAAKPNTFSPFTDVKTTAYNYDAILWAYDNRITTGTSDTTFSPDAYCTRAQIVTFLYRYYQGR